MAEVTITGIQVHNFPTSIVEGTAEKRLVQIYVDCTSAGSSDTLDLSSYVDGLQGIAAIQGNSLDGADASNDTTLNTWSGTTITFDGHAGSGVWDLVVLAYY